MNQISSANNQATVGSNKSWKTSHLPQLTKAETQFMLDIMYGCYHQQTVPVSPNFNWPVLWEYIDRQGLGGVLGALSLDDLILLPDKIEQYASHRYFSTQMHFAQANRTSLSIERAAAELKIPITVMKGPALIEQAYADKGMRQFSDIDLFTHSKADAKKLCSTLGAVEINSFEKQGYFERLGESECCGYMLDNWELEFRYPIDPPGEPMLALLEFHRDSLITIPQQPGDILQPDPELHLVFLIQHMAIHHLLSRFFWFLDIAMFLREHPQLDLEKVESELIRFGQRNVASVITQFCRDNIDNNLPTFKQRKKAWNLPMMHSFADPAKISSGTYGIYHNNWTTKIFAYLVGVVSFYLVADGGNNKSIVGNGTRWTYYRIANSLGMKKTIRFFEFVFSPFIVVLLIPVALLLNLYAKASKS